MTIVHLVHGTFAPNAEWIQESSELRKTFKRSINDDLHFNVVGWSGDNTHSARIEAAEKLKDEVKKATRECRGCRQIIVAHSHGGNIALYAMEDQDVNQSVDKIITMGTPFLHCEPRKITGAIRFFSWVIPLSLIFLFFMFIALTFGLVILAASQALPILGLIFQLIFWVSVYIIWRVSRKSLKNRFTPWTEKKQAQIVQRLKLPSIQGDKIFCGVVSRDEAGILLSTLQFIADIFHKGISFSMRLWKYGAIAFAIVFATGFIFDVFITHEPSYSMPGNDSIFDTISRDGSTNVIFKDAFFLVFYMALIVLPLQAINIFAGVVRGHPGGFGWEGISHNWLCKIHARKLPAYSNTKPVSTLLQEEKRIGRHSAFYDNKIFLDQCISWINEEPYATYNALAPQQSNPWILRTSCLIIVCAFLIWRGPYYYNSWNALNIPRDWEERYPDLSGQEIRNDVLLTQEMVQNKLSETNITWINSAKYDFQLQSEGYCRMIGYVMSPIAFEATIYSDAGLLYKSDSKQFALIDMEVESGSYKLYTSTTTTKDFTPEDMTGEIRHVCWETAPEKPNDWLPENNPALNFWD